MKCTGIIALGVVLALASAGAAVDRTEMDVVFQQGVNHYSGCKVSSRRTRSFIVARKGAINLLFDDLKLPGQDVRIISAELRIKLNEEAWGRIPNADIQLLDAAEENGKPLDVIEYRDKKIASRREGKKLVILKIPVELVKRWIENPETNRGLNLKAKLDQEGPFQMVFQGPGADVLLVRPALVVKCSFAGNAAPYGPEITTHVADKTLGPQFTIHWRQKRWDPNGTPVAYEVAVLPEGGALKTLGRADADKLAYDVETATLPTDRPYQLQVRAVDPKGLTSAWVLADGAFKVSRKRYLLWTQNSVTKVQREEAPRAETKPVDIAAARNEYESFQVVVGALSNLKNVDVKVGDLSGPGGARIGSGNVKLYRVHYVDCGGQGWLPDSMVPFVNPKTGERIGRKFGAPFEVPGGTNASVWAEVHVPVDATPGDYKASVDVTVGGKTVSTIPVALTVWPVTLSKETTLLTFFELTWRHPEQAYLKSLHAHRIDPWFVQSKQDKTKKEFTKDWEHSVTQDKDGQITMKWNPEFDRNLAAYFDGSLFEDGVPGKSYLFGYGMWWIYDKLRSGKTRSNILKQFEEHYKDKPYVDKLYWFFVDEPNPKQMKWVQSIGRDIKEHSPSIKFLLTARYHKELVGLVDVWDAIINYQVIGWNSPGPQPYRDEMAKGRMAINCITVNSSPPTSPNIFIYHGKGMNARIWTWVTYCLDQQGIEFWRSNPAPSVMVPKRFGGVWGDGSLFYRGLPEELGVPEEIALPSIRLKILRDGIEDFELLSMLRKKNPELAKRLCHRMAQETKDYDKSFAEPILRTGRKRNPDGKGFQEVQEHVIWESSAKRLAEARSAIAAALSGGE